MLSDTAAWADLIALWKHARSKLQQQPDSSQLTSLSLQLAQHRSGEAVSDAAQLTSYSALPDALWRSELLFSLSNYLNWPQSTVKLLISAGYCCGLSDILPVTNALARLQSYPPLLSAKLLQGSAPATLLQLLGGCYATERKTAYWRQQPASILLTLVSRLRTPTVDNSVTMQLANRIMQSRCEHELALVRSILQWLKHSDTPERVTAETLLTHSHYLQLRHSSNKALAVSLNDSAAWREPVLQLASELNRQQQQISELPLAINLIGRDLLDSVLIDAELNNHLSRLHHPQHAMLQQLTAGFASTMQLLAKDMLTIAKSRALARCLCTPLWFDSSGYRLSLLRSGKSGITPLPDFNVYESPAAAALICKLLRHYQLTDWLAPAQQMLTALQKHPVQPDHAARMLLIAWYSCQAVYTAVAPEALPDLLQQSAANSAKTADPWHWLKAVAEQANNHCPLLLTL